MAATRDDEYYDQDGNVVLCAQGVLFRVNRSRLSRTSVVFKSMFDLPVNEHDDAEGTSDDRPIVLSDDADDIRALLWALHLLPYEVTAVLQDGASEAVCLRLLRLSSVAHKYEVEHLDRWALDAVFSFLSPVSVPLSQALVHKLLAVTMLCAPDEHSAAEDIVRAALDAGRAELPVVLAAAETLGLSALAGHAYYRALTAGSAHWPRVPALRTNLLAGYHAFSELWLALRATPPTIVRHHCAHLGPCLWLWSEVWREAVLAPDVLAVPPADVLGKLRAIKTSPAFLRERSGSWPDKGGILSFVCRPGAVAVLDDRIRDIEGRLVEFFRLPPDEGDH